MDDLKPLADAIPLEQLRRVLVIRLRHHGEVLLSSPVFSVLKKYAPQAEIDALVYGDTAPMLSLHPAISELHQVDRNWHNLGWFRRWRAEAHLFSLLKAARYDLVIHLSDHEWGAKVARLLKPRWAVAPSVHSHGPRWKKAFTHRYTQPRQTPHPAVESGLDALRRIGIYPTAEERRLVLVPGREAEAQATAKLTRLGLDTGQFIHVHPTSRWTCKCWPTAPMAELIRRLQAAGHAVVLTGGPSRMEKEMIQAIQSRLEKPAPSLAGELSLKELAAVSARARVFVGIDSAPMHMAAAMGTPVVALFGPSSERQAPPWGVPHRLVASSRHPCRPCGMDGCGGGKISDCLAGIETDHVHIAVLDLLAEVAQIVDHDRTVVIPKPVSANRRHSDFSRP